ncbi:MAG: 6-carboxytetrahydropterin synthase [Phycisphaerae bacterium]
MYRVSKQFEFPAAHVLSKHPGRCRYPHGHNYKVEITLAAKQLDPNDMVCDFHAISVMLKDCLDPFDHSIILNSNDLPNCQSQENNPRRILFEGKDPTTEVLAQTIFLHLKAKLAKTQSASSSGVEYKINPAVRVEKVKVWESPTSWAEYQE